VFIAGRKRFFANSSSISFSFWSFIISLLFQVWIRVCCSYRGCTGAKMEYSLVLVSK
jgi:hypothetical protein